MARLSDAANYSRLSIASAGALALMGGTTGASRRRDGPRLRRGDRDRGNLVLKPLGGRRRPDRAVQEVPAARQVPMPRSSSFPSGHTAAAFAFATGVGHVSPGAAVPLHGLAALVGYSRIHTGVHFPGDVIAGALLGGALAEATVHAVERRLG